MIWIRRYTQKVYIQTFGRVQLCCASLLYRLLGWTNILFVSDLRENCCYLHWNGFSTIPLWRCAPMVQWTIGPLVKGELQINAKCYHIETNESALCIKSLSIPLRYNSLTSCCNCFILMGLFRSSFLPLISRFLKR